MTGFVVSVTSFMTLQQTNFALNRDEIAFEICCICYIFFTTKPHFGPPGGIHCLKKVSHPMFVNNFGKRGPIFKIISPVISKKILYIHTTKLSTSPVLHYLVKFKNPKNVIAMDCRK